VRPWSRTLARNSIRAAGKALSVTLPLSARKALAASRSCRTTKAGCEFSLSLLSDLRRRDPDSFHRFLWSNHLAYAMSYEVQSRFGASNINPSRHILFAEIAAHLRERGLSPLADIHSAFEVGCSMGYLLRHLEVEVCPSADSLHGLDIDEYAVRAGEAHLQQLCSKVRLFTADIANIGDVMGARTYDLVLCCGVLMYVNEEAAAEVIRTMLQCARRLVAVICLAHNDHPPGTYRRSVTRSTDGAFIHNIEQMVHRAGGEVVRRRRVGSEVSGSSPSDVILAEPADLAASTPG